MPANNRILAAAIGWLILIPGAIRADGVVGEGVQRIDRDLDWGLCTPLPDPASVPGSEDGLIRIDAGSARLLRDKQRVELEGAVELTQGQQRLEAERLVYERDGSRVEAEGGVLFEQPGLMLAGERAEMDLSNDSGWVEQVEYRLPGRHARGSATEVELEGEGRSRYREITYTTCAPGDDGWLLRAGELELDRESGIGTAHDATLSFQGVPFLYTPWASFPIDDRRKSGFLAPFVGSTSETGLDISVPYYFNVAPDMDATLTPRIMSKRGLLIGGELRYLTPRYSGEAMAELLPHDAAVDADSNSLRGALSYQGRGTPGKGWLFDTDLNYVSDDNYLDDLGRSLAISSQRHLERRADLWYRGGNWSLLGRVQGYQTIDETIAPAARPYQRLPQVQYELDLPDQALGLRWQLHGEFARFDRDTGVTGERVDLLPAVSLPLRRSWGFLTPRLALRYTAYRLDDQTPGWNDDPTRTLPTASLDAGLFFERDTEWFGGLALQTLEPRIYYLYTPYEKQGELPLFDSAEYDFSFQQLFRDNRFSGADRVADANQLTTALTSRTLEQKSGEELFRASVGQIFYFRDREVQLQGSASAEESSSVLVGEVAARLGGGWSARAGVQWDPNAGEGATERSSMLLQYRDTEGDRILNLGYRYTSDLLEQSDLSVRWPLTSQIHAVGRWNYALDHERTLDAFAGFEYDSCCWTTRFVARRYVNDVNEDTNTAVFLQLELKGLTSIGNRVDTLLERGILGYTNGE